MTFDNLLIERDGAVATVTLNRPKVLNALNSQLLTELAAAMAALKDDDGVRAIVEKLHARLPETRLLLLGVFPRGEKPDDDLRRKAAAINSHIQALDELEYVKFVDIGEAFLEDDGTLPKEVMPDSLHLSEEGYRRWARAIEPHVEELLEAS